MKQDAIRQYNPEYPLAVTRSGRRLPLFREKRFSRLYKSQDGRFSCEVSKFMDETAQMTFDEMQAGWATWSSEDRFDFTSNCGSLSKQEDFPAMLRFIFEHGEFYEWSMIALMVASCLPQEEAFDLLRRALASVPLDESANIAQALAATKHPAAKEILLHRHEQIWAHPQLWEDHKSFNSVACMATSSIKHFLEYFEMPPGRFAERVLQLSNHVCEFNRTTSRRFLGKYYPSLPPPEPSDIGPS